MTSNRVGVEEPWNIGRFYGSSASWTRENFRRRLEDKTELITAEMDLDQVKRCVASGSSSDQRPKPTPDGHLDA
jgi:N-carbamoylputrescine amidase